MKNKKLVVCLIIFACLVVLVVLSSAIFALSNVSVNFVYDSPSFEDKQQEIIDSADFAYGTNVLFLKKQPYISRLEKNFPYLKVLNIETKFPNKLVINCEERQEFFAVKLIDNTYAIIDEDYKILKKTSSFVNTQNNAILLDGTAFSGANQEGEFLSIDSSQENLMLNVMLSLREWDLSYTNLKQKIKKITVNYEEENNVLVEMHSGVQIKLINAKDRCSDMLNLAFSMYDYTQKDYKSQGIIEVRIVNGSPKAFYRAS